MSEIFDWHHPHPMFQKKKKRMPEIQIFARLRRCILCIRQGTKVRDLVQGFLKVL
jgi:hypothetical protein